MSRHGYLVLKVVVAIILFAKPFPSAVAAFADQPVPCTVEPTQKVSEACHLDSPKGLEYLNVGEIVCNFRKCFQKAGYDFDKSILRCTHAGHEDSIVAAKELGGDHVQN
jgi:hypothetical protein